MISIPGELIIVQRTGRYGNFNVAKLVTSIGEFSVREKSLDQYEPGEYEGEFLIKQIKSTSFAYSNKIITECCAIIEKMTLVEQHQINNSKNRTNDDDHDDPVVRDIQKTSTTHNNGKNNNIANNINNIIDNDEVLFGSLWPLVDKVKLDSTEDRLKLRAQRERLLALGYTFYFKTQTWEKNKPEPFKTNSSDAQF